MLYYLQKGWWDGHWGGVWWNRVRWVMWSGRWKNPCLGHSMSSHNALTVVNATPVGYRVSGSTPRSPLPHWCPPLLPLFQSWLRRIGKIPFIKAYQLILTTWYTGDEWILSVSVNCSNKMEFNFGANYVCWFFCSDSRIKNCTSKLES